VDLMEVIGTRKSVQAYLETAMDDQTLRCVMEAARLTLSA